MGLWSRLLIVTLWLSNGSFFNSVAGEVSWFLHISDLHLSVLSPSREPDLHRLLSTVLSDFKFSSVLLTGDLVEAKKNQKRSGQIQSEWESYQRILSTVYSDLDASNDTVIDIRGNHDMFDVPIRDSDRDFYRIFGAQGETWNNKRVIAHSIFGFGLCPIYVLIGVDLTPDVGLRSAVNFFGRVTDDIIHEFESIVAESMREWYGNECDPVFLAYAHYPLSMIAKESYFIARNHNGLKHILLKYGIHAWLCGHLHSEFGEHLHRLHTGDASTVLELETMDWKLKRRFRIMALDDGHLSFVNLQLKDRSVPSIEALDSESIVDGAVVLMTSPPSSYFSPLGNHQHIKATIKDIRALVWPIQTKKEDFIVSAEFHCDHEFQQSIPLMPEDEGPLYKGVAEHVIDDHLCQGADLNIRVKVSIQGMNKTAFSERRQIQSRNTPIEYPHTWKEILALGPLWYNVFQNFSVSLFMAHIVFILCLPKLLFYFKVIRSDAHSLDDDLNDKQNCRHRCVFILMTPIHGLMHAMQYPLFWWGQLCFILLLMFGPWFFARTLSQAPLSIMFLSTVYAHPDGHIQSVFAPEMTLRACFYYIVVILPSTLWIVWALNRCTGKRNGSCRNHRWFLFAFILAGVFCFACFVHSVYEIWLYYGPLAFFLSPSLMGWLLLNLAILVTAKRFSIPKCRLE